MLNWIQKRIFPTIIALSALSVSASAAFYSVTGLSKLFAGASLQVLIMAGSLEVAKLVIASLLYKYWGELNKILRLYLSIATVVLVIITSAGIYGFLSAAFQETYAQSEIVDKKIELLDLKKNRFQENRTYYLAEKKELDESISSLRNGLSNNTVQYRDRQTGEMITTTSSSQRKSLERQLESAINSRDEVNKKIEDATDSISFLEINILNITSNSEIASELGPLKYVSELTNTPINKVVNILMLVIIFVFDPLAISLVVAANFAFDKIRDKDEEDEEEDNKKKLVIKEIDEPRPIIPTEEDIEKLRQHLEKIEISKKKIKLEENDTEFFTEKDEDLGLDTIYDDENEEKVIPNTDKPQIKTLRYQPRNANRNTRIDRI